MNHLTLVISDNNQIVFEEITPIYYRNQRLLTTQQLAKLYGTTSDRLIYDFKNHREKYVLGKHYFYVTGPELKALKNSINNSYIVSSNVNSLILWTDKGALAFARLINTDQAWLAYESLVEAYFKYRDSINQNVYLSPIVNSIEYLKNSIDEIKQEVKEAVRFKVQQEKPHKEGYLKACQIAKLLELRTLSNAPHARLVAAIARELNMPVHLQEEYEDEDIFIKKDIDMNVWQVYYKPNGVNKIINWFSKYKNSIDDKVLYRKSRKNSKVGVIKHKEYRINNTTYKIKVA